MIKRGQLVMFIILALGQTILALELTQNGSSGFNTKAKMLKVRCMSHSSALLSSSRLLSGMCTHLVINVYMLCCVLSVVCCSVGQVE